MPRPRFRTRGQKANAVANKPVLSAQEKADRKLVVQSIARDLHSISEQGRKHSYGAIGRELKRAQNLYPWVTKGMVNFQIEKIKKEGRAAVVLLPGDTESETEDEESDPINVGRPRGSTNLAKTELASRKRKVLEESAEELAIEQQKGKKLQKGILRGIIQSTAAKHGLSKCNLSQNTVRSRVKRGILHCGAHGPDTPMKEIESMLVEFYIQKARMGQPMSQAEGLTFANSLIAGTPYQSELKHFQKKNFKMAGDNLGTLGYRYWLAFKKRNKDKIDSGLPVAQDVCRKEWSTYHNFASMYDMNYKHMEDARLLEELKEPAWMDAEGNIVADEELALGLKVTHKIKHPEYMLFVDEVGSNTNMKEDGRIGGETLLKEPGTKANITASTADAHFTLLGFTAGTGEPVMCAIIFAAAEMQADWQLGIDVTKSLENSGVTYFQDNTGPGKRFPGGPTCHFRGKEVPCFACYMMKQAAVKERLKLRLEQGRAFRADLVAQEGKRMSAGVLFKGGRVRLDQEILEYFEAKQDKAVSDHKERVERLTGEYNTTKRAAETVMALNVPLSTLTNPQLKTIVKWKKRKGDAAIPQNKAGLLERATKTVERSDQSLEEFLADNKVVAEEEEDPIVGV